MLVENLRDVLFAKRASADTIAIMTVIVEEIMRKARIPIGVNVLRNDGIASLSIAAATGAPFIRVNVFSGVPFTDRPHTGLCTLRGDAGLRKGK